MTKLVESLTSPVARDEAFAYVADWSRQSEWDPNTTSSRQLGGDRPAVGARYALEVRMGPRTASMEYRITELEAPSRIVLVGEGSGIWTQDTIIFSEVPGGTRVDYEAEIRLSGLLGIMQPLLGRAFDGIARGAVEGMKRELDALAGGSPGVPA
jgi:Polyketide cyclase / dehydrase and lipid transport